MGRKMHVLYFHQYFSTPLAAGGTRSYEMARQLVERGHKVTMVCAHSGKGEIGLPGSPDDPVRQGVIEGIQVIQFNLAYSNYLNLLQRARVFLCYAWASAGVALRVDYDLVFATSTPLTAGIPGILARFLRKKPFVFEVRDLWPELPRAMGVVKSPIVLAIMSMLEWLSYWAATSCIALAPGIQEGIVRRSPRNRKIAMIPNGCDLDLFQPGRRADLVLPGVKPTDCVAVFTGAHGLANGLDAVLNTARLLLDRGREDIVFAFIGDGKLKSALQARAKAERLHNCRFFDPMPKIELSKVVSCCDVGMMILDNVPAFYYGTSPNKFFDYISCGLPVLNNYPGWLADVLKTSQCGVAVPPDDPVAFADALCMLADDRELRRVYGQNARRLAETAFDRHQLATQFAEWLEQSVKAHAV